MYIRVKEKKEVARDLLIVNITRQGTAQAKLITFLVDYPISLSNRKLRFRWNHFSFIGTEKKSSFIPLSCLPNYLHTVPKTWLASIFLCVDTKASKYFSTLFRPQSSFTTGMVAGTSNWNVVGELFGSLVEENSTRAALIASLVAQWTEAARSKGGSPDAAWKKFISYRTAVVTRCLQREKADEKRGKASIHQKEGYRYGNNAIDSMYVASFARYYERSRMKADWP